MPNWPSMEIFFCKTIQVARPDLEVEVEVFLELSYEAHDLEPSFDLNR